VLHFVGIESRKDELASALAYGELRLLEVAVALAAGPTLLLLDEPVAGMNAVETAGFMETLARIHARGVTVLLVEHHMKMVMRISDRVVCLNQGRIIAIGPPGGSGAIRTSSAPIWAKGTSVLRVENVTCRYGKITAVSELSLEVHKGELVT
jgi:ABC-type branched-subunit amino acid transport system ATPase component